MGEGTPPTAFWRNWIFWYSAASEVSTAPPTTSEWPFRYLVVEWQTTSMPSASGRWKKGVAKVLSTTLTAPRARAMAAMAARSAILSMGLVGLSSHTMRVRGVMARSTFAGSEASTGVKVRPWRRKTLSKRRKVPP